MITININKVKAVGKFSTLLFSLFTLLLTGCKEEAVFEAGSEVAAGCQEVTFDVDNEITSMLTATEPGRSISYTLTRKSGAEAVSVPVKVHAATEGMMLPQTVEFAAGETTATYTVTTPDAVKEGSSYSFDVELTGDNVNPYKGDGATRFSATIAFPKILTARMYFTNLAADLGYFRQTCYDIGSGKLCFPDFLHSGTDVWMFYDESSANAMFASQETDPDYAGYSLEATLTTDPSYVEDDEDYAGCQMIWCWDEAKSESEADNYGYTVFYPHGTNGVLKLDELCLYTGDGWTGYNPVTGVGYMGVMQMNFNIKSNYIYWSGIQFRFVDPETDTTDYSEPDFGIQPPLALDGTVLTMKAHLQYNDAELDKFEDVKAIVGDHGTSITFEDFQHSGVTFKITHGIDGSFKISTDRGHSANGVWVFKDDDKWIDFYPSGIGKEPWGFTIGLYSAFNEWNVKEKRIVLSIPTIYAWGEEGDDNDRLVLTW